MRYTVEITIRDHDTGMVSTVTQDSDRVDWGWMLYPLCCALNGAGFRVDPDKLGHLNNYDGEFEDCVEMSLQCAASRVLEKLEKPGDPEDSRPHEQYADEDGWIPHDPKTQGQPVGDDAAVDVKLRDGTVFESEYAYAHGNLWEEMPSIPNHKYDIIAWRYAKPEKDDEHEPYGGTD